MSSVTRIDAILELEQAAEARPTFDVSTAADETSRVVRLSQGPKHPRIVGLPTIVPTSGPHQYSEFARTFHDIREVAALSIPGFVGEERLPATVRVVIEMAGLVVQKYADGAPVAIAGYSAGGTLAYGLAGYLESIGIPVAAVILIDAYPLRAEGRAIGAQLRALLTALSDKPEARPFLTDKRLTAWVWYGRLMMDWEQAAISAPTLLIRPTEPMPGVPADSEWKSAWPFSHDTVDVPGDHWTMMLEHVGSTAHAVERWLSDTFCVRGDQ